MVTFLNLKNNNMHHIARTKTGQFIVVLISSANGKVLSASEPLKRKTTAIRNVEAQLDEVSAICRIWQDDTVDKPKLYNAHNTDRSVEYNASRPEKKYVPK